jgi:hypothetical protein
MVVILEVVVVWGRPNVSVSLPEPDGDPGVSEDAQRDERQQTTRRGTACAALGKRLVSVVLVKGTCLDVTHPGA